MANRCSQFAAFWASVFVAACCGCAAGHDAGAGSPLQPASAPVAEPVSRARLEAAIRLSAGYLIRACGENGKFTYRININPAIIPKPRYSILRHAGTIYALAMYEQRCPSRAGREALGRAVRFLKKEAVAPIPARPDLLAVWSRSRMTGRRMPDQVKLGGVGLGLVALLSAEKIRPGTTPIADLRKMGRCILFMQKGDGSFYSKYVPAEEGLTDEWTSLYYPGEAALGLLMLYERDPSPAWLQAAANAVSYLARRRAEKSAVEADHWALLATAKLLPAYDRCKQPLPRKAILRHAIQICSSILATRRPCPRSEAEYGSLPGDGRTCPTATRLEGMLAALTFLPAEEKPLRNRIESAVASGISFLLRSQIRSGRYAGGIPRAVRPLPPGHPRFDRSFNARATEVRIDYVQHALSAMIQFAQRRTGEHQAGKKENGRKGNH